MAHPVDQYLSDDYLKSNPTWDMEDTPWKAGLVVSILQKNKIIPASICEVGCGSGGCLAELYKYFPNARLVGFDISPAVKKFWKSYNDLGIEFFNTDFLELANDSIYEIVMLLDVIEHLADPHTFLNRIRRRGKYYVFHIPLDLSASSVFREAPLLYVRKKVGHIHYFTKSLALSLLEESGYEVMDTQFSNATFTAPVKSMKTLFIRPFRWVVSLLLGREKAALLVGGETLIVLARAN